MKYFTDEKYRDGSAHVDYESYSKIIWEKLSPELKSIQGGMLSECMFSQTPYCLHDSLIFSYEKGKDIKLVIGTDYQEDWIKIELTYKNGTIKKEVPQQRLTNSPEDPGNDIMCHEILLENDIFIHTLLFSGGEELEISFSGLIIKRKS